MMEIEEILGEGQFTVCSVSRLLSGRRKDSFTFCHMLHTRTHVFCFSNRYSHATVFITRRVLEL